MRNPVKLPTALFALAILISTGGQSALAEKVIAAKSKVKWPECFCTDRYGKRHELGDIICLTVGGRSYRAKCVMAQNNPFWRDQNEGCLSSSLRKDSAPV